MKKRDVEEDLAEALSTARRLPPDSPKWPEIMRRTKELAEDLRRMKEADQEDDPIARLAEGESLDSRERELLGLDPC